MPIFVNTKLSKANDVNVSIFGKVMDNINSDAKGLEPAKLIKKIPVHRPKFGATNLSDKFMSSVDTQAIKTNSDDQNKSELANTKRPNQMKSETSRVTAQEETNAVIRETIVNRVNNEPAIRDNNEITDDNTPVITDNSD